MTTLPPDFKEFLRLLNSNGVEYLLIGGWAVGYYGYVRTTGDIDFWVAMSPENALKIAQALHEFGFGVVDANLFLAQDQIVRMGIPPLRIELLTSISGVHFRECFLRRTIADIDGIVVNVISLEDLKLNKQSSGRGKDGVDLEHLQ